MQESVAGTMGSHTEDSTPIGEGKSCPLATGQALGTKACVEGLGKCFLQCSEE